VSPNREIVSFRSSSRAQRARGAVSFPSWAAFLLLRHSWNFVLAPFWLGLASIWAPFCFGFFLFARWGRVWARNWLGVALVFYLVFSFVLFPRFSLSCFRSFSLAFSLACSLSFLCVSCSLSCSLSFLSRYLFRFLSRFISRLLIL
jgi:hypothetical protein